MVRRLSTVVAIVCLASATAAAAPDDVAARFDRARAAYAAQRCDQAEPLFAEIATKHPDHAAAGPAANLLFDCLAHSRRYDELGRRLEQLCVIPQLRRVAGFAEQCGKLRTALDRVRIEDLERAGRHEEAAGAYVTLAERNPDERTHPEALYNAAVSYARAGQRGLALRPLSMLVAWDEARSRRGGRPHPLALRALKMLGELSLALASYAEAASHFERFAERYPAEKDAPDALMNAAMLRMAMGEDARATQDLRTFARNYGRAGRRRHEIAEAFFVIGTILERSEPPAKVAEHYRAYLGEWGKHVGIALEVQARVKLAEALWRASCPVAGAEGLCITVAPPRPSGCGARVRQVKVHARKPGLAREAQDALRRVVAWWGRDWGRDPPSNSAVARARFLVAEAEHEALLAADRPEATGPVMERYGDVIKQRDAAWAVAALARMGLLEAAVADRLRAAAKGKDACRAAETAAAPHQTKAREVFARCLQVAREVSVYDDWRAACAKGLGEELPPDIMPQPRFVTLAPPAATVVLQEHPPQSAR